MQIRLLIYAAFLVIALPVLGKAQGSSLQVLSGSVCGGVVETALFASQLQGIASVSIKLNYDTNEVQFVGTRNVHPSLSNALLTSNNGQFIVAWFSLSPAQLNNDTMVVLRWMGRPTGSTALQFDVLTPGNCEVTDLQGQPLSVQFIDGQVDVMGATAPQPLTPLHLFGVNATAYQFRYAASACMQQAVFQTARDSSFTHLLQSGVATADSFALADFNDLRPAQGDSVVWWRFGGVFDGDTAWSTAGRMSFALQLALRKEEQLKLKVYPNPFTEGFWIDPGNQKLQEPLAFELRDLSGRLFASFSLPPDQGAYFYQPKSYLPMGIFLLIWKNSSTNGIEIIKNSPY